MGELFKSNALQQIRVAKFVSSAQNIVCGNVDQGDFRLALAMN